MIRSFFYKQLILCLVLCASASFANENATIVYKYLDANGVLHLTNKPPPDKQNNQLLYSRSYVIQRYTPPPPARIVLPDHFNLPKQGGLNTDTSKAGRVVKSKPYDLLIETVAAQTQLPSALLHAVVKVESAYNPKAVSPKGATGLMQLMPATARRYGVNDATDPSENIAGGAKYLRYLLELFNNDLALALAGYNAGEGAVIKYQRQIPPYPETQAYVKKVMGLYQQYLTQTL